MVNLVCHLGSSVVLEAFAHSYVLLFLCGLRNAMNQSSIIRQKARVGGTPLIQGLLYGGFHQNLKTIRGVLSKF